jgi:hypothetical protein
VPVSAREREILRSLATRVAEAASLPVQQERTRLWKGMNSLRPGRPMVLAFPEEGWRDLVGEADLQCQDAMLRGWELGLRRQVYHIDHINDDRPIPKVFNVGWVIQRGDYGVVDTKVRSGERGAYTWLAPIKSIEDVRRLHFRSPRIDRTQTAANKALAEEILGDILPVRVRGSLWWTCGLTQTLIFLRGLEQVMLDMYDNPSLLHELMAFLRDATLQEIETFEREGVLSLNNGDDDYVGSGGVGATDELPAPDFAGRVRPKDMWVLGESQEFVGVGPEQFEEFALQYQVPILKRFGRICYGCCEPLDRKFDLILRHLPNLRRVSVSAWCDRKVAAEKLGARYVYSWKPNPAMICGPTVNWESVERLTRETLQIARGCCLEMIMKDTHTFHGDRSRITRWVEIASRLIQEAGPGEKTPIALRGGCC